MPRLLKYHPIDISVRFRFYRPSNPADGSAYFPARTEALSSKGIDLLTDTVGQRDYHILMPSMVSSEECLVEIELPRENGS